MPFGEADTRAKLIDPALHARGWTEDLIRREETAGAVELVGEERSQHKRCLAQPRRRLQPPPAGGARLTNRPTRRGRP